MSFLTKVGSLFSSCNIDIQEIDLDSIKFSSSPNKSDRKRDIDSIVLHHTGPGSFTGIISWLRNKASKASAHYVVSTEGEIRQLVRLENKAWHAGISEAVIKGQKVTDLNHNSVGIEIQNIGIIQKDSEDGKFYYEYGRARKEYSGEIREGYIVYPNWVRVEGYYAPYPDEQVSAVIKLCRALVKKYPSITRDSIFTHFNIGRPIGRKNDPFGLNVREIVDKIFQ